MCLVTFALEFWNELIVFSISEVLLLRSILLYVYIIICLFFHLLMDIWTLSMTVMNQVATFVHVFVYIRGHMFLQLLGKY